VKLLTFTIKETEKIAEYHMPSYAGLDYHRTMKLMIEANTWLVWFAMFNKTVVDNNIFLEKPK